ncbi:MarR family winged helix-turn-helix transcriptional regulator, partial [Cloacibacillus evryensis]|uniref:MarR family winged helix-turn-helix transcriptional regulator n=1 Tax=Cloacibacillus evryensis TaxID=508460 RepID=UPI00210979F2
DEWSKASGISDSAVLVLHSLYYELGCSTQKMICDKWLFTKQTVNSILKDFERRGLIEFSTLDSDRRNKLVRLTPAGDDLAGSLIPELSRLVRFVMEKMGEEGRRGLI